MAKGTCDLCGMPDNSYNIEDDGKVFKVCKLCHDGFVDKNGELESDNPMSSLKVNGATSRENNSKVQTLNAEQLAKILTPGNKERKKIYAELRKQKRKEEQEELLRREEREQFDDFEEDFDEEVQEQPENKNDVLDEGIVNINYANNDMSSTSSTQDKIALKLILGEQGAKKEKKVVYDKREEFHNKVHNAANARSNDDRIKITSPEVVLEKDTRFKTNLEVATDENEGSIKFIDAFKFIINPIIYCIFAGTIVLATVTGQFIVFWNSGDLWWLPAIVNLGAGALSCVLGFFLIAYLKSRVAIDRRTHLLKIRQEEIVFNAIKTPCYRELKTKFPVIKGLAWFVDKLAYIIPVVIIVGGTITGVVLSFLYFWWLLTPIMVCCAIVALLFYFLLKLASNYLYYKLELERNQQIHQQTLLEILSKLK